MKDLIIQAAELDKLFRELDWKYCFIGGIAIQNWGEPRLTRDMDVTLLTGFGGEEPYIETLLEKYEARIPDASGFALENRVLLLKNCEGTGIDIALAGLPFEKRAVERAKDVEFASDVFLRICSAEDLIVMKAFAGRPTDWNDVSTICVRQNVEGIDWNYVREHLAPLCELKGAPEILEQLESIRRAITEDRPGVSPPKNRI